MAIDTEKPDHRLGFSKDYLTAVITLATAVLGITATFAEKLTDGDGATLLLSAWIALGLCILACLFAFAGIDRELSGGSHTGVALPANLAYFTFFAGLVLMVLAANKVSREAKELDLPKLLKKAESFTSAATANSKLVLKSVAYEPEKKIYLFSWTTAPGASEVTARMDHNGQLLQFDKK